MVSTYPKEEKVIRAIISATRDIVMPTYVIRLKASSSDLLNENTIDMTELCTSK